MTTHHVTYEGFSDADSSPIELDGEADVLGPVRGILLGIALCAPFWTAVYLVIRAM